MYLDDGLDCFKTAVPAENEKQAKEYVKGNGEVIKIKEIENCYISEYKLKEALQNANFGDTEISIIVRALSFTGITGEE